MVVAQGELGGEVPRSDLQSLVDYIGLASGCILISMHEDSIGKIEILPKFLIYLNPEQADMSYPGETAAIRLVGVDEFVRSRMEDGIRSKVNAYGHLEIYATDGRVSSWAYFDKRR